jgi:hypothetical protein
VAILKVPLEESLGDDAGRSLLEVGDLALSEVGASVMVDD